MSGMRAFIDSLRKGQRSGAILQILRKNKVSDHEAQNLGHWKHSSSGERGVTPMRNESGRVVDLVSIIQSSSMLYLDRHWGGPIVGVTGWGE